MKLKKIGIVALGAGLAFAGLGVGTAEAAKPTLTGTLSCATTGTTTITPGIVLTSSLLPKGKDKKPKYITSGTGINCTGVSQNGTTPTGYTLTSKAKGLSRVLVQPPSACGAPGRVSKTKITLSTGDKVKANMLSEVGNYAFDPNTQVSTPFPPCGSDQAAAFAAAHFNERIETRSSGLSLGKAYKGKLIQTKSVTTETIGDQFNLSLTANGVTALHGDPAFSTLTIG